MMLTPCWPSAGPTGGAGLACPAWICSLMSPETFFLFFGGMGCWCSSLDLGDLVEGQFDRCFAAEDRHQHLELLLFGVNLANRGGQRRNRTAHPGNRLTALEVTSTGTRSIPASAAAAPVAAFATFLAGPCG